MGRLDTVEARIARNPYALISIVVVAIAAIGLWANQRGRPESQQRLQAEVLSPARVRALGLSVEVQYQVREGDGWRHGAVSVGPERLIDGEMVRVRAGDRLRLELSAHSACQAYAFTISPAGTVRQIPDRDSGPAAIGASGPMLLPSGDSWLVVGPDAGPWTLIVVLGDGSQDEMASLLRRHRLVPALRRSELATWLAGEVRSRGVVAVTWLVGG